MRIAVTSWSDRLVGGIERYLERILPALADGGHQVLFWHESVQPTTSAAISIPAGVETISVPEVGKERALQSMSAWRPDIVYSHGLTDPALEAATSAIAPTVFFFHAYYGTCVSGTKRFLLPHPKPCNRKFGVPCLLNFYPRRCGGLNPLTMMRQYRLQRNRLALLRSLPAVLTHSEHMKIELVRNGVAEERVSTVPYLATTSGFATARSLSASGPLKLLFAGRMERDKGGHYLLAAAPIVAQRLRRPVAVIFAGSGQEESTLRQQAAKLIPDDHTYVEFRGWMSPPDLEQAYSEADLLVVPSIWPEPFGQVGPEAGSRGLPAVAFDVGGIKEWLTEGIGGHLATVDPPTPAGLAEAIVRSLGDPNHYAALSRGALHEARTQSEARHLLALIAVLDSTRGTAS
jgi:glycosyltransferase involved in cell wall biosynthesis